MSASSLAPSWRCLLGFEKDELKWVTVIIGVVRVTAAELSDRLRACTQVNALLDAFRKDWLSMTRSRAVPGLLWRGHFELSLVDAFEKGGHRAALFEDLGLDVSPLEADERVLVVHVHIVVALGHIDPDVLRNALKKFWPGRWRTQVKGLFEKQSVKEAVYNLFSYSGKDIRSYSSGGLADVVVKFDRQYEAVWSAYIGAVYDSFIRAFRSKK